MASKSDMPDGKVRFKKDTREIAGGGKESYRVTLPKEAVEDCLNIVDGDKIDVLFNKALKYVVLKRHPKEEDEETVPADQVFEKKTLLERSGLTTPISVIALLTLATIISSSTMMTITTTAYAQIEPGPGAAIPPVQTPNEPPYEQVPPSPGQSLGSSGASCYSTVFDSEGRPQGPIMTIPIQSTAAYLPFRMEIAYPKGDNSTFYFSTLPSSQSNYANVELVSAGIASRIFSTDFSVDNFSFVVGQQYSLYQNQIVRIAIFANNTNPLPGITIPFCGHGFAFQVNVITSLPPHIPTPEEFNAPLLAGINEMRATMVSHNVESQDRDRIATLAANGYLASMLPNIAIAVVGFANMLGLLYLIKIIRDKRDERGSQINTDYDYNTRQPPPRRRGLIGSIQSRLRGD